MIQAASITVHGGGISWLTLLVGVIIGMAVVIKLR